jgi:hypothetical protein
MNSVDNPLCVEKITLLVPVANEVSEEISIQVRSEPLIDPKIETNESKLCENIINLIYIVFSLLLILALLCGFISFLVWLSYPNIFGESF